MWEKLKGRLTGIRLRLIVLYVGILFLIFASICLWNVYNSFQNYKAAERQNMQYNAGNIMARLDNYVEQMDYMLLDAVSDEALVGALKEVRSSGGENAGERYALTNIVSDCIVTESSIRMLHRLSVFTAGGFFVTTNADRRQDTESIIKGISWMEEVRRGKGGKVLLPPMEDEWSKQKAYKVVSLVRMVRDPGKEIGFIEAQMGYDKFQEICAIGDSYGIVIFDGNQNIFYSNEQEERAKELVRACRTGQEEVRPLRKGANIDVLESSEYTGLSCLIFEKVPGAAGDFGLLWNTGLLILISVAMLSVVLVFVLIHRILKPLIGLKELLERTDLDTLQENQNIRIEGNKIREVQSLVTSFQKMSLRLKDSLERERYAYQIQMKAKFEMLQAQINPHFMHNMLNVIVNMVYEDHINEVPEICNRLSENIRYATSTKEQTVTLQQEMDYVENYMILMKKRFEHKLEYQIRAENREMEQILLPKLVLIPFIENAVYHPYYESQRATIRLLVETGGNAKRWYVKIQDNGNGFQQEALLQLEREMKEYVEKLCHYDTIPGLSIGGLGIVNTYARLKLYAKGKISLRLFNAEEGGAVILLQGGTEDVPDSGSRG